MVTKAGPAPMSLRLLGEQGCVGLRIYLVIDRSNKLDFNEQLVDADAQAERLFPEKKATIISLYDPAANVMETFQVPY